MSTPPLPAPGAVDFEALFAGDDDPWRFRTRWYERRKRALTLACLPEPRYRSAFEPGCANGELAAELAPRCDALWAQDGVAAAVAAAQRRLAAFPQVRVSQGWLPDDWPDDGTTDGPRFDLVVLSELAYYLEPASVDRLIDRIRASLWPEGTVLACHWRRPIHGCAWTGDAVHAHLQAALTRPARRGEWQGRKLMQVLDEDLRLEVWQAHPRSVAAREGLVDAA